MVSAEVDIRANPVEHIKSQKLCLQLKAKAEAEVTYNSNSFLSLSILKETRILEDKWRL
jgi:hypothetical protein